MAENERHTVHPDITEKEVQNRIAKALKEWLQEDINREKGECHAH